MSVDTSLHTHRARGLGFQVVLIPLLGLLVAEGCTDRLITPSPQRQGYTRQDSLQRGALRPSTAPASELSGEDPPCDPSVFDCSVALTVIADPTWFSGASQPNPVTFYFSTPVHSIRITGSGAILCSGDYGILTAYASDGKMIKAMPLELIDPSDCSTPENPDNVTYGSRVALETDTIPIATATLTPMAPIEFPVLGKPGGRASQSWWMFAARAPVALDLKVKCPTSAVRGEEISCRISLSDPTLPFTVTSITSSVTLGGMGGVSTIGFAPPGLQAPGQVYDLHGPAVAPTTLTVEATVEVGSTTRTLTKETRFAVLQRPREQEEYVMTLRPSIDGPGETTKWPERNAGAVGLYSSISPDWNDITIATAASGPDKGLSYVLTIPGIPASSINLSFALFPGDPWYQGHPVTAGPVDALGKTICTRSSIDALRLGVERHEGATMFDNSHYGIDQNMLRKWHFAALLGGLVSSSKGSPEAIRKEMGQTMQVEWEREHQYVLTLQSAFDAVDTPALFATLGCSIFLD